MDTSTHGHYGLATYRSAAFDSEDLPESQSAARLMDRPPTDAIAPVESDQVKQD